jgi:hypothetical protein
MTDKNKLYSVHSKPTTRREFLSRSFTGIATAAVLPSIGMQLLSQMAPSELLAAQNVSLPMLTFDLVGGASLSGNFLVGGPGGPEDLLPTYDLLGWDPKNGYSTDFGLPMAPPSVSKIREGINSVLTNYPQAIANFRLGSFCNFSRDDTAGNSLSALQMVSKAGLSGSFIRSGVGSIDSLSGGNSMGVFQELSYKPLRVSGAREIINSLTMGQALKKMKPTQVKRIIDSVKNLSQSQKAKLETTQNGKELFASFQDSIEANKNFAGDIEGVDPRLEPAAKTAYGINETTAEKDSKALISTIVMNVLKGHTGPGVVSIGGCDYHDGTQTTGDNKDREIGENIGRAVLLAHLLQKPLFIHIISDGSVYPKKGTRIWVGDAGEKSLSVIGIYDPKGPRSMKRVQVGSYTKGQGVDRDHLIGADPVKVTQAVFANYLSAQNQLGLFEKYVPNVFSGSQLDSLLIF